MAQFLHTKTVACSAHSKNLKLYKKADSMKVLISRSSQTLTTKVCKDVLKTLQNTQGNTQIGVPL